MERRKFEQLGNITAGAILALGGLATEGCTQASKSASVRVESSTLPTAPTSAMHGSPQCTSEGRPSNAVSAEIGAQDVQKDIATSFNLSPRDLIGTSLVVKVACAQVIDARTYPKIAVTNLAGSYSEEGHCVLIPVSNMAVSTTDKVAECVETVR